MNKKALEVKKFKELVKGNIFSVTFLKKNGELREMLARFGVKAHLKGGQLSYDAESVGNLIVFDMKKQDYRTIRLDSIQSFTFNKVKYEL